MPGSQMKDSHSSKEHNSDGANAEDLSTTDEVKVFKDEGEDENEQDGSENLQAELFEEKSSLITESEHLQSKYGFPFRPDARPPFSVLPNFPNPFELGYLINPYGSYASGASHMSRPFMPEHFGFPPPAHMGSLQFEKSGAAAVIRPNIFPNIPPGASPYGSLGMEHLAAWHQMSMYQHRPNTPYPIPSSSSSLVNPMPGFPNGDRLLSSYHLPPHYLAPIKTEHEQPPGLQTSAGDNTKGPHIKKPLNAFMLYMKEMRPVVQAECTLKESAAINQILGRRWHGLSREEQAEFYEKARQERQKHMEMYPNWNARDNYRFGQKTKKRKRDKSDDPAANIKKCRARYGLEQQNLWCKPCNRKKKCIRVQMYLDGRSEQEIEAANFCNDEDDASSQLKSPGSGRDEGSPFSHVSSVESNENSAASPEPVSDMMSIPSLESPSCSSPSTPGASEDWMGTSYKPILQNYKPIGTDPRDVKNPLSIFSLTSSGSVFN